MPIPGTTKLDHLEENLGAREVQLTSADVRELEDGFAQLRVVGARAPEVFSKEHDIGVSIGSSSTGTHGKSPLPGTAPRVE